MGDGRGSLPLLIAGLRVALCPGAARRDRHPAAGPGGMGTIDAPWGRGPRAGPGRLPAGAGPGRRGAGGGDPRCAVHRAVHHRRAPLAPRAAPSGPVREMLAESPAIARWPSPTGRDREASSTRRLARRAARAGLGARVDGGRAGRAARGSDRPRRGARHHPELVHAAAAARRWRSTTRLKADLRARVEDLRCRGRRRGRRDARLDGARLHDGAQQRLVALSLSSSWPATSEGEEGPRAPCSAARARPCPRSCASWRAASIRRPHPAGWSPPRSARRASPPR